MRAASSGCPGQRRPAVRRLMGVGPGLFDELLVARWRGVVVGLARQGHGLGLLLFAHRVGSALVRRIGNGCAIGSCGSTHGNHLRTLQRALRCKRSGCVGHRGVTAARGCGRGRAERWCWRRGRCRRRHHAGAARDQPGADQQSAGQHQSAGLRRHVRVRAAAHQGTAWCRSRRARPWPRTHLPCWATHPCRNRALIRAGTSPNSTRNAC